MVAVKGLSLQPIPGISPQPPAVSLLTAAKKLPGEWKSGVSWRSAACAPGYRWVFCGTNSDRTAAPAITKPAFYPYLIYVPYECDWVVDGQRQTVSGDTISPGDYRADAQAQCEAVTPFQISQELWTGSTEAFNPSLESVGVDKTPAGGAVHPVVGLGLLMDAYAASNAQGGSLPVIHTSWRVVVSLMANHIVNQVGDAFYGPGCIVSPGPGYPSDGSGGPANAAAGAGNVWMYVSGPVEYAAGPIEVLPLENEVHFDRRTNTYRVWAQRMAIHRFDTGCIFATKVAMPVPGTTVN